MYCGVYLITNKVNGKSYVGKTVLSPRERFRMHVCKARQAYREGKPIGSLLGAATIEYGEDNFTITKLESIYYEDPDNVPNDLHNAEARWMAKLNTIAPNGYNLVRSLVWLPNEHGIPEMAYDQPCPYVPRPR